MWASLKEYARHFVRYFRQWWRLEPHLIVGDIEDPYLKRWWIIPRNPLCNIYLHQFLNDDDDRALHDHPFPSISFLFRGGYKEHLVGGSVRLCESPALIARSAKLAHRIELLGPIERRYPAWTLFITGPKVREWGFLCKSGWVHWTKFIEGDGTEINRSGGCPDEG